MVKKGWDGASALKKAGNSRANCMKGRLILSLMMSSVMVCMVTLLVTYLNLGFVSDFLTQWAKAYIIAWPVAAGTAFTIMPACRRMTDHVVERLERKP
jgi:hypothetical protein